MDEPRNLYHMPLYDNYSENRFENLFAIYFCPHCEQCFFVHYRAYMDDQATPEANILYKYPNAFECTTFSDKIDKLSPKFVEIYHQSEKAEQSGLTEISGMGYRKALEFLVKDYAIHFHPENTDDIKQTMLSPCINTYITNDKIKDLARASAWIGNDESHYIRKHEDYNVDHLKVFISAAVAFITSDLTVQEAQKLLSNPK